MKSYFAIGFFLLLVALAATIIVWFLLQETFQEVETKTHEVMIKTPMTGE